jgi:lysophospholipase L1-like esterase
MAMPDTTAYKSSGTSPRTSSPKLGIIIALMSLLVTLGAVELALRVIGFSYRLYPEKIEFGWPNPTAMQDYYQPDDDLLWVPKDYAAKVAVLKSNPPDLILMGDSCTEFGTTEQFFPVHAAAAGLPPLRVEKVGVGGWSSFQGLQQLRRDITSIRPKVVTIYFGWNDHWMGFGIQDKEIGRLRSPLFTLLEHSRFAQLITKATLSRGVDANSVPVRVSLPDFRSNLEEMVKVAREAGITPVLLTAPSSHRVGKEPDYLRKRHLKELSQLVPLHRQYVDTLREVATHTNTPMCDLFADFAALPDEETAKYFNKDGIHLTKGPGEGYDKLAEFLVRCLKDQGVLGK